MINRLATSFVAVSSALAAPSFAFADVTAADVWANQQALFAASGISLTGDLSYGQLTNPQMNIVLPQGAGSMQITVDAVSFMENGDGSVTVTYPSPTVISITGSTPDDGGFDATMTMTHGGYTIMATGTPGDVSYETDAQDIVLALSDLSIDDGPDGAMTMDGFVTMAGWSGTSQVIEGDIVTYTSEGEVGLTEAAFTVTGDDVVSTSTQTTQTMTSQINATLPAGGVDMMNMSAALRDGLSVAIQTDGAGSSSVTETIVDDQPAGTQITSTGEQTFALSISEDGLSLSGDALDFAMAVENPMMMMPGPIEFGISQLTMAYDIPLNASEEEQDFRIATSMDGITVGDMIWNMFDPEGELPRDPAEVTFDVTGSGTTGIDLLDFASMMQMKDTPPIEIDQVTIENLVISAAGATAMASGAMTFDWTDMQTIPGIARPEGRVLVNLDGANALMDRLVAAGLLPEDQLMMPRMMLGMFATPVGDDQLESVLEVNEEGHVLANGQRLR